MNPVEPICADIARARGELALLVYFDQRLYSNPSEMQAEQERFRGQVSSYQHPSLVGKDVKPTEAVLRLNSPEAVQQVIGEVSQGYKGMVYDVFLTDDKGQMVGKAWKLYDFLGRIDPVEGILTFTQEVALTGLVPESVRPQIKDFVKTEGTARLKERGLEDKVAEWEAIFA